MTGTPKSTPEGFRTIVTPYLCIKGAASAIEFYQQAFGATEADHYRHQSRPGRAVGEWPGAGLWRDGRAH